MTAPTLSSTLHERLKTADHNSERAGLQLQLDTILTISDQTTLLNATLVLLVNQSQSQNKLLSAQLDGVYEQLQAIRRDLREESIWHKFWTGVRRMYSAFPVVI
jgi:hypothetical protein